MRVRARVANPGLVLQPGLFGRVNVPGSLPYQGILVPDEAVDADQDRRIVYVVDEAGTVSAKPVRLGPRLHGYRVIREGLAGDETIVINGLMRVRPGVKVKPELGDPAAGARRARRARHELRQFLRRPSDLRDGSVAAAADRRRHLLYPAAGRAVSGDRAADRSWCAPNIRAPTPTPSPRPWRRRSSRKSTASRTCSTCRPIRPATASMALTITFRLGTDLDQAQVLVQNRVSIAEPRLPEEVRRLGITTTKSSPDLMMVVHMLSPDDSYDQLYVSNYARIAGARRAVAARRRGRSHHLRRARIFAAHLARSGQALRLRHDGERCRAGAAGPERPGLGRRHRRAADHRRQRLPVHGDDAGPVRGCRASSAM